MVSSKGVLKSYESTGTLNNRSTQIIKEKEQGKKKLFENKYLDSISDSDSENEDSI